MVQDMVRVVKPHGQKVDSLLAALGPPNGQRVLFDAPWALQVECSTVDVFVEPTRENARRLHEALVAFGFGSIAPTVEELAEPDRVWMLGRKPRRIDILTGISGVPFARAAKQKVMVSVDEQDVPVIGRVALIENKLASGRTKHLLDVEVLQKYGRRAESARKKRPTVTRRKTPSRA